MRIKTTTSNPGVAIDYANQCQVNLWEANVFPINDWNSLSQEVVQGRTVYGINAKIDNY